MTGADREVDRILMRGIDAEVNRALSLLRRRIRSSGVTQVQIQEELGWGRSYISQLLTRLKCLRLEQLLRILAVIGADAEEFFQELYGRPQPPFAGSRAVASPTEVDDLAVELRGIQGSLQRLAGALIAKGVLRPEDLDAAAPGA